MKKKLNKVAKDTNLYLRRFIELCAEEVGREGIEWAGKGLKEVGRRKDTGDVVVTINPNFYRPAEVETLVGNSLKAFTKLGWKPKIKLEEGVKKLYDWYRLKNI